MDGTMRAITIRQPWASLIALGYKRMETRSWNTKVRGWVAIHAGLGMPAGLRIGQRLPVGEFEVERDRSGGLLLQGESLSWPYRLPMGAVVAVGELFQTRSTNSIEHKPDPREASLGDHSPDRFAWSLASVSGLRRPLYVPGAQGFWTWHYPPDLTPQLRYPLERAS